MLKSKPRKPGIGGGRKIVFRQPLLGENAPDVSLHRTNKHHTDEGQTQKEELAQGREAKYCKTSVLFFFIVLLNPALAEPRLVGLLPGTQ